MSVGMCTGSGLTIPNAVAGLSSSCTGVLGRRLLRYREATWNAGAFASVFARSLEAGSSSFVVADAVSELLVSEEDKDDAEAGRGRLIRPKRRS